ncbi:hypothetical protein NEMBOFW57_001638 [Staphylotrichum longicolle]|uniref:DNA (cytosine-5-)-methyltransferase n=1 Tax=Staphylotrichum longicolle TaxID=669026 RepID=A0AAD4HY13_9PEZI|nr:hypothetical protein NEMBOFW57_001638 [Staphylotrichum longicolle]
MGARMDSVIIEGDDDLRDIAGILRQIEEETQTGLRLAEWVASLNQHNAAIREGESPSASDAFTPAIEDILEREAAEIVDLTGNENHYQTSPRRSVLGERREFQQYALRNGLNLKIGMTVELDHLLGDHGIQFLRVESIFKPSPDAETVIRGFGFARTRELDGLLPRRLNEVVLVAETRTSHVDQRDALLSVSERDVKCCRELRLTNSPFPSYRFSPEQYESNGKMWVENHAPLVCRFRYDIHYKGDNEKPCEWAITRITESDADSKFRISDDQNLSRWRGGKVHGGSYSASGFSQPVVDLEKPFHHPRRPIRSHGQKYTAGDVFAGAGGASRGIERAGVKLVFAVDHWDPAAQSLRSNFRDTRIYNMEVTDFITSKETTCDVDILHLSPPCQFWSPAHTVAGKNDEKNIAVLFACTHLIQKFRPRLFTVEQTFGILSPKFSGYFNTLIHGFTEFGYSVRWKVIPLADYGVPQLRKRLIMIGSAPGEKLPPFPPPTHSKDGAGGLKPWVTPQSVLARLYSPTFTHPLHEPHRLKRFAPSKDPWDPTKLAKTITTNGGQNYHWDGTRDFTLLEYAVLQGFPTWHRFEGGSVKKQIGNAFAPSVVKVLYDHLVRWLLVQDGFDPDAARRNSRAALPRGLAPRDHIRLDYDGEGEDGSVEYLGTCERASPHRLSEVVRRLNRAAKEEGAGDVMDLDAVDDLSDTETLRAGEGGRDASPSVAMADAWAVTGTMGTANSPYIVWD